MMNLLALLGGSERRPLEVTLEESIWVANEKLPGSADFRVRLLEPDFVARAECNWP